MLVAVDDEVVAIAHGTRADVRVGQEALQSCAARRALQVQGHRLLACVEDLEDQRVTLVEGLAHAACIVAAIGALHLDDFGAEAGKDRTGERARQYLPEFQDPDAF
ncbi:hypothetical protein SRS16P2_00283 (plasmid) [Variovorax sp. SRS16]|nr:hypothetical protein SRS16P2_00283 [Variovorax sp. SRS16]